MTCNYKGNNNYEYSKFPTKSINIKERIFVKNVLESIANCTHVSELTETSSYIMDPFKDFGLINLRTSKINCAIISPENGVKTYDCYPYDLILYVGANGAKIINYDFNKVLIFTPENPEDTKGDTPTAFVDLDDGNKYSIYGKVIITGIDWKTNSFIPLGNEDIREIKNAFYKASKIYIESNK